MSKHSSDVARTSKSLPGLITVINWGCSLVVDLAESAHYDAAVTKKHRLCVKTIVLSRHD